MLMQGSPQLGALAKMQWASAIKLKDSLDGTLLRSHGFIRAANNMIRDICHWKITTKITVIKELIVMMQTKIRKRFSVTM